MSLIITAEIPAGPTIEQAIKDCVEFAERNHCMVKTTINDVPMLIAYGSNFTNHPGQPYSVQDCTDFFVEAYYKYLNSLQPEVSQKDANLHADEILKKDMEESRALRRALSAQRGCNYVAMPKDEEW